MLRRALFEIVFWRICFLLDFIQKSKQAFADKFPGFTSGTIMSSSIYGTWMFGKQEPVNDETSWWNLQFILVVVKTVILISQGLHTEK